jgi:type II secretory pathway pseudopilin PulG
MRIRHAEERGESLVEIVFTIVIIGLVSSALFAAFATGSTASNQTRNLTIVDTVLRNAAEATKTAVRASCIGNGTTYSVDYEAPNGFTPPADVSGVACPPRVGSTSVQAPTVTLTAAAPNGATKTLKIAVRSP